MDPEAAKRKNMDPELLKAIRLGGKDRIKRLAEIYILEEIRSPEGNTILHMAARLGKWSVLWEIFGLFPSLLVEKNSKGEAPVHTAAAAGNYYFFHILILARGKSIKNNQSGTEEGRMISTKEVLMMKDKEGNTPLHIAVRNGHIAIVHKILSEDNSLVKELNEANESPLAIAIDASLTDIARYIIYCYPHSLDNTGTDLLTLLRTAMLRNDSVMFYILKRKEELINGKDKEGRNLLHLSAVSGHYKMSEFLLKQNFMLAYEQDCDSQTPLHLAAKHGRLNVLKMLVNDYPDASEKFDKKGRNILHLAAKFGHAKMVAYLLNLPEVKDFVNSLDLGGNTPLHLAAMNFNSDVVYILCRNKKVNIRAKDNYDTTALEIAQSRPNPKSAIQKHLTIKALKAAYANRALVPEDILENLRYSGISDIDKDDQGKEMAQTLSVMATLIATFTFTAAFTMPGGYTSDGPNKGMAVLIRKTAFQAFVITDTIAMTSSMTAAVVVFWSFWQSSRDSFMDTLPLAFGLTWIGLVSMAIAFVTGLFVVLSHNMSLAVVVCSIGCTLPFIFYVFVPVSPLLSSASLDHGEDNPFAFTLRIIKLILHQPLKSFALAVYEVADFPTRLMEFMQRKWAIQRM